VARLVESRCQEQDVPFALDETRLGVICPETSTALVWDMVGRLLESAGTATFAFGPGRELRALAEAVEITAGIAQQSPQRPNATELLDEALAALERARESAVSP
jgi:GGDEF domain-containing protein